MRLEDWHDATDAAFACQLRAAGSSAPRGCIAFNPGDCDRPFALPDGPWDVLLETSGTFPAAVLTATLASPAVLVPAHSLLVLRRLTSAPEPA
jgi:hypothetical protein